MNMKMVLAAVLAAYMLVASGAAEWKGLSKANWYSGRKLTAADLAGKVVLVDEWGVYCGPCIALLPEIEKIWRTFKSKPFIVIGSHRQGRQPDKVAELVKKNNLTYPIYDWAGVVGEPSTRGIPFLYVVNAQGKVVFSGAGGSASRGAIEAIVNALESVMGPTTLTGDVTPVKFKALARQLVIGKSCESVVRQLKAAAKGKDAKAQEAADLVAAVEQTQQAYKDRIADALKERPAAALVDITAYRQTWPSDAKSYEAEFKALSADADVGKCAKLRATLAKYRDFDPRTPSAAKKALAEVKAAQTAATALGTSANAAVAQEATSCGEELAEIAKELEEAAAPKRTRK